MGMVPSCQMMVYYVRKDKEVVADSIEVDVEDKLENQVKDSQAKITSLLSANNLFSHYFSQFINMDKPLRTCNILVQKFPHSHQITTLLQPYVVNTVASSYIMMVVIRCFGKNLMTSLNIS